MCGRRVQQQCSSVRGHGSVQIWPEPWTPKKTVRSPSSEAASWSAALTSRRPTPTGTHTHTHGVRVTVNQQEQQNTPWDALTHPCSLLCHTQLGSKVCVLRGECDTLKHTLLHLGNHQPYQHAERRTAHVQTRSVGEILLEVIKCT